MRDVTKKPRLGDVIKKPRSGDVIKKRRVRRPCRSSRPEFWAPDSDTRVRVTGAEPPTHTPSTPP